MADDSFENLRFYLMQDVLPVGLAIYQRARAGKVKTVVETFRSSKDPLNELRNEGETAAQSFRKNLDDISPGLGNPIMPVDVSIDDQEITQTEGIKDQEELNILLQRIDNRLEVLGKYLPDNISDADEITDDLERD